MPRRFPPPWSIEESDACFIVRDSNGQAVAYVYFEDEPDGRSVAKLLTRDGSLPTQPSYRTYCIEQRSKGRGRPVLLQWNRCLESCQTALIPTMM